MIILISNNFNDWIFLNWTCDIKLYYKCRGKGIFWTNKAIITIIQLTIFKYYVFIYRYKISNYVMSKVKNSYKIMIYHDQWRIISQF